MQTLLDTALVAPSDSCYADDTARAFRYRRLLDGMQAILLGGGPIDEALHKAVGQLSAPVYHTYGMTETATHIALRRLNGPDPSDAFVPLPGVELARDDRGCLAIRGAVTAGAWLQTNDIVDLRPDGSFVWLGRWDNVINTGGVKVQVEQVEAAIAACQAQRTDLAWAGRRLAVAGLPDARLGQAVTLVLAGAPLGRAAEAAIRRRPARRAGAFCRGPAGLPICPSCRRRPPASSTARPWRLCSPDAGLVRLVGADGLARITAATPKAVATLSDRLAPRMGMASVRSQRPSRPGSMPVTSLPTTSTVGTVAAAQQQPAAARRLHAFLQRPQVVPVRQQLPRQVDGIGPAGPRHGVVGAQRRFCQLGVRRRGRHAAEVQPVKPGAVGAAKDRADVVDAAHVVEQGMQARASTLAVGRAGSPMASAGGASGPEAAHGKWATGAWHAGQRTNAWSRRAAG